MLHTQNTKPKCKFNLTTLLTLLLLTGNEQKKIYMYTSSKELILVSERCSAYSVTQYIPSLLCNH
jgi:hypothetical protein